MLDKLRITKNPIIVTEKGSVIEVVQASSTDKLKSILFGIALFYFFAFVINKISVLIVGFFSFLFLIMLVFLFKKVIVEINPFHSSISRYSKILGKEFKYDFIKQMKKPLVIIYEDRSDSEGDSVEFYFFKNDVQINLFTSYERKSIKIMADFFTEREVIFNGKRIDVKSS